MDDPPLKHQAPSADNTSVPAVPVQPASPVPQLSPEHHLQLAAARKACRKVRRAISVANFDGWTVGIFACFTLLTGFSDPTSIIMGLGMAAVACVELRSVSRLRRFDAAVTRTLAFNQIVLAAILTIYALWRLHAELSGGGAFAAYKATDPELAQALLPFDGLARTVSVILYGSIIAIAFFAQGGMALYYFTRGKHIDAYLAQTPPWIIDMQKAGITL
jgi:hypothetical protein